MFKYGVVPNGQDGLFYCHDADSHGFLILQIAVPRHSVGVVIGRNGEMIKKIQSDTGVKIQFKPGKHDEHFGILYINDIFHYFSYTIIKQFLPIMLIFVVPNTSWMMDAF